MPMPFPRFLLTLLVLTAMQVTSQVTPSSWRKPDITTSLAERVRLAGAALDTAIDRLGTDDDPIGAAGDLYAQMALFDMATNQSKYESALGEYFEVVLKSAANFSNPLPFGHAALYAYTAYNKLNPTFLQYAIESWWFGRRHTLSTTDVAAGKFAGKNFTLSKVCHNATMAGGTFKKQDPNDLNIEGFSTGLSALLAEATGDPLYLAAANQSAAFIHAQLYNVQDVVQSFISASASDNPCFVTSNVNPLANESGIMIEGLAVLAAVTGSKDTLELLNELLVTVTTNAGWQRENGILSEGDEGAGDSNVLRALGIVYRRNLTTPAMRQYVGDYIGVQFNAVVDLARSNGTDIYADSWTGPPSANFSGRNQTDALGALVSAIYLGPADELESSPTTPTGNPVPRRKLVNVGAIVGGTIGGLLAVGLLAGLGLFWVRKRRGRRPDTRVPEALLVYEPFTGTGHSTLTTASSIPSITAGFSQSRLHPIALPSGAAAVPYPRVKNLPPAPVPEMQQMRVVAAPPPQEDAVPPMATERLITLLSERLEVGRHEEEAPPQYPFSDIESQ
ncbi:hypothetical protein C8R46DRAFT_1081918 [Mycena filopes]|nr:hypothetical protein C8R46DRAFT_1081918 [Mycena filopes]